MPIILQVGGCWWGWGRGVRTGEWAATPHTLPLAHNPPLLSLPSSLRWCPTPSSSPSSLLTPPPPPHPPPSSSPCPPVCAGVQPLLHLPAPVQAVRRQHAGPAAGPLAGRRVQRADEPSGRARVLRLPPPLPHRCAPCCCPRLLACLPACLLAASPSCCLRPWSNWSPPPPPPPTHTHTLVRAEAAANPVHTLFYIAFMLSACALFSITWIEVRGLATVCACRVLCALARGCVGACSHASTRACGGRARAHQAQRKRVPCKGATPPHQPPPHHHTNPLPPSPPPSPLLSA